jgi:hypothetical protein
MCWETAGGSGGWRMADGCRMTSQDMSQQESKS